MAEVTGLVEMNSHMIRTGLAEFLMFIGIVGGCIMFVLALTTLIVDNKKRGWLRTFLIELLLVIGFIGVVIGGNHMPMEKKIQACAVSPVSLEQIAVRYKIESVDGKLLTLIER